MNAPVMDGTLATRISDQLQALGVRTTSPTEGNPSTLTATATGAQPPAQLVVELRSQNSPVLPAQVARWRADAVDRQIMVAQWHITPARGAQYRAMGLPYIDAAGNCSLEAPGVHLLVEGRQPVHRAAGEARPSRAFGRSGLKVLFVLLTQRPLLAAPLRQISHQAQVSLGTAQAVLSDLVEEGHVRDRPDGRQLTDPSRLSEQWVAAYHQRLAPTLASETWYGAGPDRWLALLKEHDPEAALSGEAALAAFSTHGVPDLDIRPVSTLLYGDPPWHQLKVLGQLRRHGSGSPVTLRERFWRTDTADDHRLTVPDLLVYADLAASPDDRWQRAAGALWEASDDLRHLR
nr:type IV toxin-antitoxin system AbiEi family antitoxin [Arsenicicoccus piscis]